MEEPAVEVSYDAAGSAAGRQRFISGKAAYAASDTPLEGAVAAREAGADPLTGALQKRAEAAVRAIE